MTTGKGFARAIEQLRGGGWVFVVDSRGGVHQLTVEHYSELTAAQLEGAEVCLDPDRAERVAERRRARN
jgi:hypothetical protein